MRKWRTGGVVIAVALVVPAPARSGETTGRHIPLRVVAGRLLIVPVRIDGTGPYPFLLDTGATRSLVDEALADRLRLPRSRSLSWSRRYCRSCPRPRSCSCRRSGRAPP